MTTLTETAHDGEFILSAANGSRSRDAITLTGDGVTVVASTVLGAVETGTPTATAGTPVSGTGGTVGDGVLSSLTADAGAPAGEYSIEMTGLGATAAFKVVKPDGTIDGVGNVGTAYDGTINFTQADGAADFAIDDVVPITVEYQDGESVLKYEAYDPAGTDGSEVAAGILFASEIGTAAGVNAVAVTRESEVNSQLLIWPAGITADEKAVGLAQLAALDIVVRT